MTKLMVTASTVVMSSLVAGKVWAIEPDERLIRAQILVESGGNDRAVGDKHLPASQWAYGCLQVRQCCVDDVNRYYGTFYQASDCLGNRALSILIYKKYLRIYSLTARLGHQPTQADFARIWNGGPAGWKHKATLGYWRQVQVALKNLK